MLLFARRSRFASLNATLQAWHVALATIRYALRRYFVQILDRFLKDRAPMHAHSLFKAAGAWGEYLGLSELAVKSILPRQLPGQWEGYDQCALHRRLRDDVLQCGLQGGHQFVLPRRGTLPGQAANGPRGPMVRDSRILPC